jgi:hypothetical protein
MRELKLIYEEVAKQATEDNCQSLHSMAIVAMETAVKEKTEEIIENLEKFRNNYEVIDGAYIIQVAKIDYLIESLEK